MDHRERFLRGLLADLESEYKARARPIIDALVELERLKPPRPFIMDIPPEALAAMRKYTREVLGRALGLNLSQIGEPPQWPEGVRVDRQSRRR